MNGSFNWRIAATPEPSTWAMLLLGFVGLACAGVSRSKVARAVAKA